MPSFFILRANPNDINGALTKCSYSCSGECCQCFYASCNRCGAIINQLFMAVCNMLLVTVALFGRSQLYIIESLPVVLHVKFNARPSVIVLGAEVRVITAVSRSRVSLGEFYLVFRFIYSVAVINTI